MTFVDVERFGGTIVVAAPPGLFVENLKNAIFYHCEFTMPPLEVAEAHQIEKIPGINNDAEDNNFAFMRGITFDIAKARVDASVSKSVQQA